jgi:hypothetical protein
MLGAKALRRNRTGKKKPAGKRAESIFLEENRGDMCIMLHRKIKIQFILPMTVINVLNSTAETV